MLGTGSLPIQAQLQLLDHLPQGAVAKQGQCNHQPHRVPRGQLASSDGGLAAGGQRLCNPTGVYQRAEFARSIRYSGQGLAQGALQQAHQKKGERVQHIPLLLDQITRGLN